MSFTDPAAAVTFVTAGKATFTLESEKTGTHFTYRVDRIKNSDPAAYYVSVLTGSNNETDYSYAGILRPLTTSLEFKSTAKSKVARSALSVSAFVWFWDRVQSGNFPPHVKMHHKGACGRCGRSLTTPESVERGIGPECAGKLAGADRQPRQKRRGSIASAAGPAWIQ